MEVAILDGIGIEHPPCNEVPAEQLQAVASGNLGDAPIGGLLVPRDLAVRHVPVASGRDITPFFRGLSGFSHTTYASVSRLCGWPAEVF